MRVLRGLWKLLVGIKDALVLLFMLIFFALLYAGLSMSPNPAAGLAGSGALLVDLDGTLVEQPRSVDAVTLFAGGADIAGEYRLRDLVSALEAAKTDSAIKAVVLDLDGFMGGGQATLAEAAAAIRAVRQSGKPVLAFATGYTDDSYQLAAAASEVWLDPLGAVMVAGPGGTRLYWKGLLDSIGVTANVYRVGSFKSAVEPFTRSDQSTEARAANQALADALWARWQSEVVAARPKARLAAYVASPEAFIRAGRGSLAGAARAAGLVDRLGDRLAFGNRIAALAGKGKVPGSFESVDFVGYAESRPAPANGKAIGVITVAGEIVDGEAGPGVAAGDTIAELLLDELAKDRISALVVRIDSPGGSVLASERIRNAILAAKDKGLPVVASMGSVAASGGYWVATPADRILADPATITGSIGVFGIIPSFERGLGKLGIGADGVRTTPLSGQPDLLRGTSPEFDRLVQLGVEDVYRRFTDMVAKSRNMPVDRVDAVGQGRVWAGATARELGLVDGFASLDGALAEAARLARLNPKAIHPIYIERAPNPFEKLLREAARSEEEAPTTDVWSRLAATPRLLLTQAVADADRLLAGPAIQARCLECGAYAPRAATPREVGLKALAKARLGLD